MGGGGITLGRIRGIRIGVDYSWFLVLFLVVVWLSGDFREVLGASNDAIGPYLLALVSAMLFFASILLHELGHAIVAQRNGIGIAGITLWLFGGVARMERDTESAGAEFRIAIAGPAVTLAIALVGFAIGAATEGTEEFFQAARLDQDADISAATYVLAWVTFINLAVLIFNLVPAFPMDGGRVVRALAWWRSGDRGSATRFAAGLGRGFAFAFIGLGVFLFVTGAIVSGVWMALIGWVLNGAAASAAAQTRVSGKLEGIAVRDVMDDEPVAIGERMTVDEALESYFLRYRWPWFPVVAADGAPTGLLRWPAAEGVPESARHDRTVLELMDRAVEDLTVRDDATLESVLGRPGLRSLGALLAVDAGGRLTGVVTVGRIGRALRGAFTEPGITVGS